MHPARSSVARLFPFCGVHQQIVVRTANNVAGELRTSYFEGSPQATRLQRRARPLYAFGIGSYLSPETGTRINGNREGLIRVVGSFLRRWSKGEAFAFDPNRQEGGREGVRVGGREGEDQGSWGIRRVERTSNPQDSTWTDDDPSAKYPLDRGCLQPYILLSGVRDVRARARKYTTHTHTDTHGEYLRVLHTLPSHSCRCSNFALANTYTRERA